MGINFTKLLNLVKSNKVIFAQATLYTFLFLSFNNKTFFLPILFFALYLYWLLEDWRQAAWLTLIAVFPFEWWGLRYFKTNIFSFPMSASFLISCFLFLSMALFSLTPSENKKSPLEKRDYFILTFLILSLISFSKCEASSLGVIGFWGVFQPILFYFLTRFFTQNKRISQLTLNSLFLLAGFEGLWASTQYFLQRPLGRILEPEKDVFQFGITAFEDVFQFRSSGTLSHPNTLLIFLALIFPLILSQSIIKKPLVKNKSLRYFSLIFSCLGIVFTMSRYGWLIIFLISLILIYYFWKTKQLSFPFGLTKKTLFFTPFFFLIILAAVWPRIINFSSAFKGKYSSWRSRKELIQEAWFMIKNNPFFGVGPDHFLIALKKNRITAVADYFFYPVHNLYLLIASEFGLPALFSWIIFLYLDIKEKIHLLQEKRANSAAINIAQLASLFCFLFLVLIYTGKGINLNLFFIILGINLR
jgi:O-antigen ligase